ncbi:hypothetical protein EDE15_4883 [Edaphobacter aggregans]|uniref:Uncharacterized protein n=1 Tax=Edaphobacter aggregans TaxID=570835 RepID=A0A3R9NXM8_9BACT|nr:hypothetical protein [Edaphobacter aggregans]RSL19227.1 hypothetical protein EDE15_4883 [Edaphobacter aggregans]
MTEPNVVPEVAQETPEDEGQGRSTIRFPYLDQDDAVKLAKAIHSVAGNSCSRDALAAYLKVSAKAGGFNLRTGTAKMFGLIESDKGLFSLTDLGKRVIDPKQEKAARADSFLLIPLYKRIFDQYRNQMLPANPALEKAMEQMGVAPKQADKARQAFQRSATQAGYFAFGTDRLIAPQGTQPQAEAPPPPLEEKPGKGGQGGNGGDPPHNNPFIQGLLSKLPPEDAVWSTDQRKKWLQLAISVFEVSYKTAENDIGELSVTLTKTSAN